MPPTDNPIKSDHKSICIDINVTEIIQAKYSELSELTPRKLTMNNMQLKQKNKTYINKQMEEHHIWERALRLYNKALTNQLTDQDERTLNELDAQVKEILLTGEKQCAKDHKASKFMVPFIITGWITPLLLGNKVLDDLYQNNTPGTSGPFTYSSSYLGYRPHVSMS